MPALTDLADIRARLELDRSWAAFSLADLDPPLSEHARWFGPVSGTGVVLVYGAYSPAIVVCHGDIDECHLALAEDEVRACTQTAYLNMAPEQARVLQAHFPTFEQRAMVRMVLTHAQEVASRDVDARVERLRGDDLDALRALYAEEPPAFFLPSQLQSGVYYGVRDRGALVAVAGTHVVSETGRVAALGNVHTRSDARGRGLAAAVTQAVCRELLDRGIVTIVLNIVATNEPARRVYERVGFREYCRYAEGMASREIGAPAGHS